MKKVLSLILLVAMVVGCFAGCTNNTTAQEDPALAAAAEYLYAMYKDNKTVTGDDYTVVSQVQIDGVVYPITWTSDAAEANVKIIAGSNNMTTVEINGAAEEITYTLTATLKNAAGQTASVSFTFTIPAKAQVGGKTMVLAYPKENKFITGSHYLYTGKNKWQLELTESESEAIALTVIENADETVTFKAGEYYLFCDATHVQFVKEQGDYTKFVLEAADNDGGYYIKCAVANYGGKAQYLEVYSGYLTSYGMGTDPSIYVFKLQETTTAAGTVSGLDSSNNGGSTTPTTPSTPSTTPTTPTTPKPTTPTTPSTPSGSKVVLSFPKESKYVTGNAYTYTSSSGSTKQQLTLTTNKSEAVALEKITNSDGTISFKANGKYLYADGTHVKFDSAQGDYTKFVLEAADGGYYVKCAVANYNGNPQYLEVYKGYLTCYGMSTATDLSIFVFKLEDATGASGSVNGGSSTTPTTPTTPSTPSGGSTVTGTLAATLDLLGTTTRVSRTASQTVHAANGITYTNDKASSITDNYDQAQNYAARAYKDSTVKIEYTGMKAIVIKVDTYEVSGKTYMAGFDGMTVAGATITRDGDTITITFENPTNVFQSTGLASQTRIISISVYA